MEKLYIKPTYKTPEISFNPESGIIEIKGRSIIEEVEDFYKPLFDALNEYFITPQKLTTFNIRLDYLDTHTSKMFIDLFKILERCYSEGKEIVTNWYYEEGDDDIKSFINDFTSIFKVPVNVVKYQSEE